MCVYAVDRTGYRSAAYYNLLIYLSAFHAGGEESVCMTITLFKTVYIFCKAIAVFANLTPKTQHKRFSCSVSSLSISETWLGP